MKYKKYYCSRKYSETEKVYYGNVEATPEIPMIEAESIDDFERLFHQAVDDFLDGHKEAASGKKWRAAISALVIIGLLVAMVLTCPKKEQHGEVLSDRITYVIGDQLGLDDDLSVIGTMLGGAAAKKLLDTYLIVDDYFLISVGRSNYKGEKHIVSFGVLGHVFCASREQMVRNVEEDHELQEFFGQFK